MKTIAGLPMCEVQFTKDATVFDPNEIKAVNDMLAIRQCYRPAGDFAWLE